MQKSSVVHIFIAQAAGEPVVECNQVHAVAGRGLEGDRYFKQSGTSPETNVGDVTLIQIEAIEALKREHGIDVNPGDVRRNIITRGVSLNALVGREFQVGEVTLRGTELCEPCSSLAKAIGQPAVLKALLHRGGLRAQILTDGIIHVGDAIHP